MHDGVVEQVGGPLELYDRPANTFVAGFIGSPAMNMFPATVRRTEGAPQALTEFGVALPLPPGAPVLDGQRIVYGVRPEHVVLTGENDGVPVTVSLVEPLGSQTAALVRFGEDSPELQLLSAERLTVRPDDKVWVRPVLDEVHVFDGDTGARL
jgi:multiple sugar transport system ATP-binding protein